MRGSVAIATAMMRAEADADDEHEDGEPPQPLFESIDLATSVASDSDDGQPLPQPPPFDSLESATESAELEEYTSQPPPQSPPVERIDSATVNADLEQYTRAVTAARAYIDIDAHPARHHRFCRRRWRWWSSSTSFSPDRVVLGLGAKKKKNSV